MAKFFEYSGTKDSGHPIEVNLKYCLWPVLFSDQWFLPRFKLKIKNLGKEIQKGSVQIDIVEFSKVEKISQISSYKGPFQDVYHREISNFHPSEEYKITFKIESRFLAEGEYIIRILFKEWIPSDSPMRDLEAQFYNLKIPEEKRNEIRPMVEESHKKMGIDPYAVPKGQYKSKQLLDLRFIEKIKIHSLSSTATIMGMFIGSVLAVFVGFLYTIVKITNENWDTIIGFFK